MTRTIPNGGNVPIKSGNLARSALAQVGSMPETKEVPSGGFTGSELGPVLLNWDADETLYIGFQAKYAARQNYGFTGEDSLGRTYNQSGFAFVEKAVAKWPFIVSNAARKVWQSAEGF
jgi:hypothetical protein|tara:strand:+ start:29052 stop:29405 length:354 start_codon:yes stop_codon:yes gene_type:complete